MDLIGFKNIFAIEKLEKIIFGALLEIEISKKCMLLQSTYENKNIKMPGRFDCDSIL